MLLPELNGYGPGVDRSEEKRGVHEARIRSSKFFSGGRDLERERERREDRLTLSSGFGNLVAQVACSTYMLDENLQVKQVPLLKSWKVLFSLHSASRVMKLTLGRGSGILAVPDAELVLTYSCSELPKTARRSLLRLCVFVCRGGFFGDGLWC